MVCGVWCLVCVCGVWCLVCGVWCVVFGVWCVVCGVWCVVTVGSDVCCLWRSGCAVSVCAACRALTIVLILLMVAGYTRKLVTLCVCVCVCVCARTYSRICTYIHTAIRTRRVRKYIHTYFIYS